jgi:hypothetical protein
MRIISKFKDYYDHAGQVDPGVVYIRKTAELRIESKIAHFLKNTSTYDVKGQTVVQSNPVITMVAGKCYLAFQVKITDHDEKVIQCSFGTFQEYAEYLSQFKIRTRFSSWRKHDLSETALEIANANADELHRETKSPVITLTAGSTIVNPNLIRAGCLKYLPNSQDTFRQVEWYLSNTLRETKPIENIADKYKITQHGFDKHSFRHPTKLK